MRVRCEQLVEELGYLFHRTRGELQVCVNQAVPP